MKNFLKNKLIISIIFSALTASCFFAVNYVYAAPLDAGFSHVEGIGLGNTDPRDMVVNLLNILFTFLGIIAVIVIMYAGWLWMTSAGEQDKVDKAKKIIIGAVIGLVVILASYSIVAFIVRQMEGVAGGGGGGGGGIICAGVACGDGEVCCGSLFCSADPTCGAGGPAVGGPEYCDSDTTNATCDADNTMCSDPDAYYCNVDTCICDPRAGLAESCYEPAPVNCNTDATPPCETDLNCNSALGCVCAGAPVIDWISPVGGFCYTAGNVATDDPCIDDAACIALGHSTCATSTPNGAPGNLVTIGGRYFGTATGTVYFSSGGANPDIAATIPDINGCNKVWTDDQIIVIVPSDVNLSDGPVRVQRPDGEYDDSGDGARGPIIEDFLVNNIVRPGLCGLVPDSGVFDEQIFFYGLNMPAPTFTYFGLYNNNIPAIDSQIIASNIVNGMQVSTGEMYVPNIAQGNTSVFAINNNIYSNYVGFIKEPEPYTGPYITGFEPTHGAPGQYVTVFGSGFGKYQGISEVVLDNGGGFFNASFEFPEICADSFWSENQIIFKIPDGLANDDYVIRITIGNWSPVSTEEITPDSFTVNNLDPLLPSICKISPKMGPQNSEVSLWGEYFDVFDNINSKVRFHFNQDQLGANIGFWDDIDPSLSLEVYMATTTVAQMAATGPVRIVKGNPESVGNAVNFTVGLCTNAGSTQEEHDEACGVGSVCCPNGSVDAGRCVGDITECFSSFDSSVYEWGFSTAVATTSLLDASCAGFSDDTCPVSSACPNSPGQCSTFPASNEVTEIECSATACNADFSQCTDCIYDSASNACVDTAGALPVACDLNSTTNDILGNEVTTFCDDFGGTPRWQYVTQNSCVSPWVLDYPSGTCVDSSLAGICTACESGFACLDENNNLFDGGICGVNQDICPSGSSCDVTNVCEYSIEPGCECCCEIANGTADCCSFIHPVTGLATSLTCAGECGSDKNVDTNTYGSCTGCRIDVVSGSPGDTADGVIDGVDQAASDQACNCSESVSKYCDINSGPDLNNDGNPDGTCGDCAELSDDLNNCSYHNATCCVDAVNGGVCGGGDGTYNTLLNEYGIEMDANGPFAYCSYYECDPLTGVGVNVLAVASSTIPGEEVYTSTTTASSNCGVDNSVGESCDLNADILPYPGPNCSTDVCMNAYECLSDTPCGNCCCNIDNSGLPNDTCKNLNPSFYCGYTDNNANNCFDANQGVNPDFGTCCGCSADIECASIIDTGCGLDTCCNPRPEILSIVPVDGAAGVCRNPAITVEFDSLMDITSFKGNVILLADYDQDPCPEGTEYLSFDNSKPQKRNIIVRTYYKIKSKIVKHLTRIFPRKFASAYVNPSVDHNYCAITGRTSGYQLANDHGVLKFEPTQLLDSSRLHYVIIKGDESLDSARGVMSRWKIGYNGENGVLTSYAPANTEIFNGITYTNAFIWSFTTVSDQGPNQGVCLLDEVDLIPDAYLFKTITNDLNEPDDQDYIRDSDKIFVVKSISTNDQEIVPIPGIYDWDWNWFTSNADVADFVVVPTLLNDKRLIRAGNITDGRADINVQAEILTDTISAVPAGTIAAEDTSKVYVFVCENPWPPIDAVTGYWEPWIDDSLNCNSGDPAGDCYDTSYELYYCRDSNSIGTYDDLPAILNDATVRTGDITENDVKEVYYFRAETPSFGTLPFNILENSDFEDTAVGSVPDGWTKSDQRFSDISVTDADAYEGDQSILIHQDPNQPYPGVCGQALCTLMNGCTWLPLTSQCSFNRYDNCHPIAPAIYNVGQTFCSPNTNRVMWATLYYDISDLDWTLGDEYSVEFYYKGYAADNIRVNTSFHPGSIDQCVRIDTTSGSHVCADGTIADADELVETCVNQPAYCCRQYPAQESCYNAYNMPQILPGVNYDDWILYSDTFEFTSELDRILLADYSRHLILGLSIGYNDTGPIGTDIYIDNFVVKKVISQMGLTVVNNNVSQIGESLVVSWQEAIDASSYNIYWGTKSGTYTDYLKLGDVTTYTFDNLTNLKTYYFNVTPVESVNGAEGDYIGEGVGIPFDAVIPPAPINLSTDPGDRQVSLFWDAVTIEPVTYKLYYTYNQALADSGNYGYTEDLGQSTSVVVSGLQNGMTYYFSIGAIDLYGNEATTTPVSATPIP